MWSPLGRMGAAVMSSWVAAQRPASAAHRGEAEGGSAGSACWAAPGRHRHWYFYPYPAHVVSLGIAEISSTFNL